MGKVLKSAYNEELRSEVPECFCDAEAMSSCDWVVKGSVGYHRPGQDAAQEYDVGFTLTNIPQLLAYAIVTAQVQAMNARGAEVYEAWMTGCFDGDTQEELISKVRQLVGRGT